MIEEADPAGLDAIRPLAALPLFFRLAGRRAALAGGGDGAAWKAELIASTGARVDVFAPELSAKLSQIASRREMITINERRWRAEDLAGAALAILETEDDGEARDFCAAARAAGVPVNVIDRPDFSDFSFGTLVNRSPLVIAVSTDGAAPVFAQAIRTRLEALIPAGFAKWAEAAREWRRRVAELGLDFRQRRRFWERFAELALRSVDRGPEAADFEALAAARAASASPSRGRIFIVGAGPGDPDLLTLKAVRALQSADVVMFDRLAPQGVVELARREARRIPVGKRAGARSPKQPEITAELIALARQGKTVVRLKGGDPGIFGRANEEIEAARAAGVPLEIIPGVTTALAAAAELGVSLSDRDLARRIQFVAAHDAEGELPEDLDWPALASADASTAVYMGVRKLPALVARLLAAGLDPATPAVLMQNVSRTDAMRIRAAISDLPAAMGAEALTGPTILLYGRAFARVGERVE